ncbi:DUF3138 family protein [uncultured Aquitalea sp.]|uniref:DUF3138 family protein n=1 Tax=uncultured Aquitalea sp. TaxID=540272 RepID=UPI0025E51BA4|nr:DUF3138 family protein [uncultured Aquitalea sp.]
MPKFPLTLMALLLAGLPWQARADELDQLKAQLAALQSQVSALQARLAESPAQANTEADEDSRQRIAALALKVDKLGEDADTGPLANLSISGYLDPYYSYNRNQRKAGFTFVNHSNSYAYDASNIGDVYLDIKKSFGSGPMAPYADISLMPNRGIGMTSAVNASGSNNSIINAAQIVFPLDQHWQVYAGQLQSFAGYEVATSPQTLTITHNLLFDFSEPGTFVGAGAQWISGNWLWKGMLGNEVGHVEPASVDGKRNNVPSFTWRMDYLYTNNIDIGWSGYLGRGTASNYSGTASPYQSMFYSELDISNSNLQDTWNAQLDYGSAGGDALDGGRAVWWGLSLLRHHRFNSSLFGKMGWTLRYDYLDNSRGGGGNPNLWLGDNGHDGINGFGSDPACVAANGATACKGAKRQALTAALLFYPSEQLQLKLEARYDLSSQATFDTTDGTTRKSNATMAAQAVYSF